MSRRLPTYDTPSDTFCSECKQRCLIVGLENEFSYSGTHCNHGQAGTEYPPDWGSPVSDCCYADITDVTAASFATLLNRLK
jgi:hypothetical protein